MSTARFFGISRWHPLASAELNGLAIAQSPTDCHYLVNAFGQWDRLGQLKFGQMFGLECGPRGCPPWLTSALMRQVNCNQGVHPNGDLPTTPMHPTTEARLVKCSQCGPG